MAIKLSKGVLINCPDRRGELRRATACFTCPHYAGVVKATQNGVVIESDDPRFLQILCAKPITRNLTVIIED